MTFTLACGVLLVVVSIMGFMAVPSVWRGENKNLNRNWMRAGPTERACYRSLVPALAGGGAMGIASIGIETGLDGFLIAAVGGSVFLLWLPLLASVWFWNRPRFLVPPPWRGPAREEASS
jgi:hypothetical protein